MLTGERRSAERNDFIQGAAELAPPGRQRRPLEGVTPKAAQGG